MTVSKPSEIDANQFRITAKAASWLAAAGALVAFVAWWTAKDVGRDRDMDALNKSLQSATQSIDRLTTTITNMPREYLSKDQFQQWAELLGSVNSERGLVVPRTPK